VILGLLFLCITMNISRINFIGKTQMKMEKELLIYWTVIERVLTCRMTTSI